MMDELTKQVRTEAYASCAWMDAVDPNSAANLRAVFSDSNGAETFESVHRRLGDVAAQAWQDAVDARKRYFTAVHKEPG